MSGRQMPALVAVTLLVLLSAACSRTVTPADDGRTAVWLDISPAYGDPPRDPGDAFALLQAYGSGRLSIRGVSVTFGNVPLVRGYPVANELMQRIDTRLIRPWRGASSREEGAAPTEATELLEEALGKDTLTILALGPATTVASVLRRQPQFASRMERIVLVGGHSTREAGLPRAADTSGAADSVAADPDGLQVLLDSDVAITLVAPGLSTGLGLDSRDLDRLDAARGPVRLVLPSARGWLQAVTAASGGDAFAVPAMLAVDAAAHPGAMRCESATATLRTSPSPATLLVSTEPGTPGRPVAWCHTADAGAKDRILTDLMRLAPRP